MKGKLIKITNIIGTWAHCLLLLNIWLEFFTWQNIDQWVHGERDAVYWRHYPHDVLAYLQLETIPPKKTIVSAPDHPKAFFRSSDGTYCGVWRSQQWSPWPSPDQLVTRELNMEIVSSILWKDAGQYTNSWFVIHCRDSPSEFHFAQEVVVNMACSHMHDQQEAQHLCIGQPQNRLFGCNCWTQYSRWCYQATLLLYLWILGWYCRLLEH